MRVMKDMKNMKVSRGMKGEKDLVVLLTFKYD